MRTQSKIAPSVGKVTILKTIIKTHGAVPPCCRLSKMNSQKICPLKLSRQIKSETFELIKELPPLLEREWRTSPDPKNEEG